MLAAGAIAAALLAGCSSGDGDAAEGDCTVVAPSSPGVTELTVVAKGNAFQTTCYEVQPGAVTVTFTNEDTSNAHNFHLSGNGVNEATSLFKGKRSEVLELQLTTVGSYGFICDPHPYMKGRIVVAEPASTDAPATTA